MSCELKAVDSFGRYKGFIVLVYDISGRHGMGLKTANAKARARDRGLFDMAMSLC